jgi:hypothetical protein
MLLKINSQVNVKPRSINTDITLEKNLSVIIVRTMNEKILLSPIVITKE